MRNICHESRRLAAWAVLILPGIVTSGCDRPVPSIPRFPPKGEFSGSSRMSTTLLKPRANSKLCRRLFAPGCEPSDEALLRYPAYRYEGKPPVQSGDSATVTVIVKDAKTGASGGRGTVVDDEGQRHLEAQGRAVTGQVERNSFR